MKRLLIPLLAVIALPNAVNAETWYLLITTGSGLVSVPMKSEKLCEQAADDVNDPYEWRGTKDSFFSVNCIRGK